MRLRLSSIVLFFALLALSAGLADARKPRKGRRGRDPSFVTTAMEYGQNLYKQTTAVFPVYPSNTFLRKHASEILGASAVILAFGLLFLRGKRSPGKLSVPVPGYEARGTRGGSAPRRRVNVARGLDFQLHDGVNSLAAVLQHSAEQHPDRPCVGTRKCFQCTTTEFKGKAMKMLEVGDYQWKTYREFHHEVLETGSALRRFLSPGDVLCIYANSCEQWQAAAYGAFFHSITVATSYANLGEEALVYSLKQTGAKAIVCEALSLDTVFRVAKQVPSLKTAIVITGGTSGSVEDVAPSSRALKVVSFQDLVAGGGKAAPVMPSADSTAMIMYTSGSTGVPKGVVIRHGAIVAASTGLLGSAPALTHRDVYMAYLPLAHILEVVVEAALFQMGASVGYGSPFTLVDGAPGLAREGTEGRPAPRGDAVALRPTLMAGVPRVWNTIKARILGKVEAAGGIMMPLFKAALSHKVAALRRGGTTPILDALLFRRRTAAALGGRLRLIVSGGGPLAGDTQRFIESLFCVEMAQGYGLTETCGAGTMGAFGDPVDERVGAPAACCDVRLVDWREGKYTVDDTPNPRGEVWIAGPCLASGYFANEELTKESFFTDPDDGRTWFKTGDIGEWHADGVLKIVGRKKSILKLSHGEYLSLEKVDSILQGAKYVASVATHAESGADFAIAVVVADVPALQAWARSRNMAEAEDPAALVRHPDAIKEVHTSIKEFGRSSGLVNWEIPRHIVLDNMEWTPDNGMLTAAMKLRRGQVVEHYKKDIERFYPTK